MDCAQPARGADRQTATNKAEVKKCLFFIVLYMNVSRLCRISCVPTDRMGCSSISGLVAAVTAAAGPDEIR